ncbi:MAG: Hsp70 family protein [Spirillospora sp.]
MSTRETIDFGIDLGTTNSAVAIAEPDGSTMMIKNNDGWDTTPSAVWIPSRGVVQVGRAARDKMETVPENCAAEFKQEMGQADAGRTFAKAGISLSPPELSAEVLKSLRGDVAHVYGGAPDAAVITVPAAFTLNQNNATKKAAELAGLKTCPLVQEPTAAAVAYGFTESSDQSYWMVFDFGGGTFDAAVVSKHDGDMRVVNHSGDPYLGGKLIDWAIAERLLAPEVSRQLGWTDFRRDNPRWKTNFARLKRAAEDAKIALSRSDTALVMAELKDEDGREHTLTHTISRGEVDDLAEPLYTQAVNLSRKSLKEGGLSPDDIDRLVLVGGVTLMPGLRERLADRRHGLGIELDFSVDPTTVVARGAAILASTIRRPVAKREPAPGEFTVTLAYQPVVTTTRPTVAGELHSARKVDWTTYSVVLDNPHAQPPFRTPRIAPSAKGSFIAEVDIDERATSRFSLELLDGTGARQKLSPDTLTITHRTEEAPGVTLTSSLGIQLADRAFAPLVRKGATVPTRVREVFRTTDALRRSDTESVIRIPVVQGESPRGDRNRRVGMVEIRPEDVRLDLPAGTEIEVTFEVDSSNLLTAVADVPLVQAQFEVEIDMENIRAASAEELESRLRAAESRLDGLRGSARGAGSPAADRRLAQIDEENGIEAAREQARLARMDPGAAAAAEERLRNLEVDMDEIEEATDLPDLIGQLREVLDEAAQLVNRHGTPADRKELSDMRRRADDAIASQDPVAIGKQLERATEFLIHLERRTPDWPVKLFYLLREQRAALQPAAQAKRLFQEGEQAIASGDVDALNGVNARLVRLMPTEERQKIIGVE